ncbi:MAG: D-alanyl-D-alanine carboxypeptidase family protein [Oscillospiraceae bacterium]
MPKIKRYKNQRRVIILRGIKYLLVITVLLLALAFVLTTFVFKKDGESPEASGESVSSAESETTAAESDKKEDENIDNAWAMFLVNKNNPLPLDYDSRIETKVIFESWREYYLDVRAAEYFEKMLEAAKEDGIDLLVVSAYRTIEYQQQNFDRSVQDRVDKGMSYDDAYADTLAEVALPGESEHNAGLALDIMSQDYTSMEDDGFENTDAFAWLDKHAAEYGFILRYPKGKQELTGIIYEPWHYRFVGVYYANEIKESGLCLEEYYEKNGWLDSDGKATDMLGPVEAEKPAETTVPENTEPKETMPTTPYSEQKATIIV